MGETQNCVSLMLYSKCRFSSNYFESGSGFKLEYETSYVSQWSYNSGSCGGNFTTPYGFLTSPSYPDPYPEHAKCIYTISRPTGTYISMNLLGMDIYFEYDWTREDVTCLDRYHLEIRDGDSDQSPVIGWYCGDSTVLSLPIQIESTQNNVWMR